MEKEAEEFLKELESFKKQINSWVIELNHRTQDLPEIRKTISELDSNSDFNYELINKQKEEIEKLKEDMMTMRTIQSMSLEFQKKALIFSGDEEKTNIS